MFYATPMRPRHVKKKRLPQKTFTLNLHTAKKHKARTDTTSSQPPSRSQKTSFAPNLHNLLARSPVQAIFSASPLASRRTSTTATQIAGSRHSSDSSLPSRRTSTIAAQIARAERLRRGRVRRSLETNRSRREPRSKGLFFMIFPFPQFGFRIGCSDFLFDSSESFKF